MIVAGIDPGTATGVVVVDLPHYPALDRGKIVRAVDVVLPAASSERRYTTYVTRLTEALTVGDAGPRVVALEEPGDVKSSLKSGGGRAEGRWTKFTLGAAFGVCYTVAAALGADVTRYTVHGTASRDGWLTGKTHERVVLGSRVIASKLGAIDAAAWSDDCLMAFGLLIHHLTQTDAGNRSVGAYLYENAARDPHYATRAKIRRGPDAVG